MLRSLTLLLLFQLAGEVCARLLAVPIPGPVIGMLLMLLMLLARRAVSPELRTTSLGILENLSLLFVPAGVGVMVHFNRLSGELAPIVLALFASTLLAVAATALTLVLLARARTLRGEQE